ncbi:MBL fold metallo-hydrolase [Rhodococcus sp. NPDC058521]|uniref:MBL fold metallo-hydrolase n=1 Tax=Rhodococcus sp. NPDC058521 TaxID=3346536 RepID=UPI0036689167
MNAPQVIEVGSGIYLVTSRDANWTLVEDSGSVTLIDAGYPGSRAALEHSLSEIGRRPEDIVAALVTHAHVDHIGTLPELCAQYGFPVYTSEEETRHAHREYLQQVSIPEVAANSWRPGVIPWSLRILRLGGTKHVSVPGAQPFPVDGPLDLPGGPVPVPLPGHTSGHCGYHLPSAGAVVTGDALVTGHGTSRITGPQLLLPMYHHDRAETLRSLDAIADVDADLVLPGHGPLHRGEIGAAVATARNRAGL